jgi:hypothetical protein
MTLAGSGGAASSPANALLIEGPPSRACCHDASWHDRSRFASGGPSGGRERDDEQVGALLASSLTTFIEQHSQWAMLLMFALLTLESFGLRSPAKQP